MLKEAETSGKQADPEEFSGEKLAAVDAVINNNRQKSGSLIPVLEEVQEILGYVPKSIQKQNSIGPGKSFK